MFLFDCNLRAMRGAGSPMAVGNYSSGGDRSKRKVLYHWIHDNWLVGRQSRCCPARITWLMLRCVRSLIVPADPRTQKDCTKLKRRFESHLSGKSCSGGGQEAVLP